MSARKKSVKPPPKKVHFSLSQQRAICGAPKVTVTRFRSDITCRACKRLSRRLPASSASIIPVKYTLVVIGPRGKKAVYIDTTEEEAIRRYLKTNGNTAKTRAEINRTEVLQIADQFWATRIWAAAPGRKVLKQYRPRTRRKRTSMIYTKVGKSTRGSSLISLPHTQSPHISQHL